MALLPQILMKNSHSVKYLIQALSDTVTGGYCDYIGYCDYLADSRSQMPYFILMPYLIL